jgi:outer membrane receptor protein involved in Fe transport
MVASVMGVGCVVLPESQADADLTRVSLDQGWRSTDRALFSHQSQGSVVLPYDRYTFDLNYIYRPEWMEGLELGASVENIFDEDPIASQTNNRGYVSGNPRGRIFQLEVTKRF